MSSTAQTAIGPERKAVIVGGAGGIGFAFARLLYASGATVALLDLDAQRLEQAASDLGSVGDGQILMRALDISDPEAVQAARDAITAQIGPPDLLVNAAGLLIRGVPVAEIPHEAWRRVLDVNLLGVVNAVRSFLPDLKQAEGPAHIITVASISGFFAGDRRIGAYATSKFAVVGYSEALAEELTGSNVTITLVAPGQVATDFYRNSAPATQRFGMAGRMTETPEDIRNGMDPARVASLALDAASRGQLYAMTHADLRPLVEARQARVLSGFEGRS
ncbi:SDR family NAD(P)-dependent oxidoreductase [Maritimibacter sp. DP07]|uniref:SDR family NAD(P)-dependent oxidoreductase n=1 Tax=Maritimibacter harenae TaxID=2606218 RepID=A0A845M5Q7_9RHOB|nr:SDR family oxidoreductase [Maritimibacter harenae]MZR11684.1 SDR family NAD(P)-dependent oxidoreductase [Maritimibacter harenae]